MTAKRQRRINATQSKSAHEVTVTVRRSAMEELKASARAMTEAHDMKMGELDNAIVRLERALDAIEMVN